MASTRQSSTRLCRSGCLQCSAAARGLDECHTLAMDKPTFISAFADAAQFCRDFAQSFIIEELPQALRFNFDVYQPELDATGKFKFTGGRLVKPEDLKGLEGREAGKFLWVDGKIPQWINLEFVEADEQCTYIRISFKLYRFTNDDNTLMHKREGNPPFHILFCPPGGWPRNWESVEKSGKISIKEKRG